MIQTVFGRRKTPFEAFVSRIAERLPAVLKKPKVSLAVLAGIMLPLVGLLCSLVILAEEKRK